uniref:Potassium channel tetramerisation-type BTB domain-containing protein n=1 Tax=Romanomermis culicivorax TaxID=13658 RepID=A0A915JFE9_ROMCU
MLPSAVMSPAAPKKGKTVAETMAVNGSEASPGATPTESTSQDPSSLPCNLVTINVGGLRYQTYAETLEKYPDTLLGDPVRRKPFFNQVKQMESLAIIAYDGGYRVS